MVIDLGKQGQWKTGDKGLKISTKLNSIRYSVRTPRHDPLDRQLALKPGARYDIDIGERDLTVRADIRKYERAGTMRIIGWSAIGAGALAGLLSFNAMRTASELQEDADSAFAEYERASMLMTANSLESRTKSLDEDVASAQTQSAIFAVTGAILASAGVYFLLTNSQKNAPKGSVKVSVTPVTDGHIGGAALTGSW